ncbi:hypothetical protein [Cupriavidus necator]
MQIQIEAFIHAQIYAWKPDQPHYQVSHSKDMSFLNSENSTYVMIKPITITAELPDDKIDYRAARISALEKEREKIRADMGKRITEIAEEISKLQAIEHTAEVAQ